MSETLTPPGGKDDRISKIAKKWSDIKTIVVGAVCLMVGSAATGAFLKQHYLDLVTSYNALQALQTKKWGPNPGDGPAAGQASTVTCPEGSYMVGISTRPGGSLGGGVGLIVPLCRQLKLE